jgi:hypothetical protein
MGLLMSGLLPHFLPNFKPVTEVKCDTATADQLMSWFHDAGACLLCYVLLQVDLAHGPAYEWVAAKLAELSAEALLW